MKRAGLFFGSFNPIHIGHLAIANYFYSFTDLDEIWFVVTPQNPWKEGKKTMPLDKRVALVKIAVKNSDFISVTDFEKDLEQPNYTYTSLLHLKRTFPEKEFVLLIGGDNYESFHDWKFADRIQSEFEVLAYIRNTSELTLNVESKVVLVEAPIMNISSTFIRESLSVGKNMQYFLPEGVYSYLVTNNLIKKYYGKDC